MLESNIILFLLTLLYVSRRYQYVKKHGKLVGFFTNPLLWYIFFMLFYCLSSNIFLMLFGQQLIVHMGAPIADYNFQASSVFTTSFFLINLSFYLLSKDNDLKYSFAEISMSKQYNILLISISFLFLIFLAYIFIGNYWQIYSLRYNRALAYDAYVNRVVIPYKYGISLNISVVFVATAILISKNRLYKAIVFFICMLVFLIDYSHGGRVATLKLVIAIYISLILYHRKSNFILMTIVVTSMLFSAMLTRFVSEDLNLTGFLFAFLSEFIFTRITVDLILNSSLHGSVLDLSTQVLFSLFPGQANSFFGLEPKYLGSIIQEHFHSPIGLACNPVTEAIYFFGSFYLIGAIIISWFLLILNSKFFKSSMVPLFILILYISSLQDIIRNSFFSSAFYPFYLCYSYGLIFSILFYKKVIKLNCSRRLNAT